MNNIKKMINFIKQNSRYVFALAVLVLFFLINRAFPAEVITSESCAGGTCPIALEAPNLTDKEPAYFANDVFKSSTK
ncbi:MAG: hypothetical protein NTZ97_00475 [Candidatus Moranbacteria bacterium]|nr:hypothetical protein [Candidatus Moranbacteria bacterium]